MPNHVKNIIKMCGIAQKNDLFTVCRDDEEGVERTAFDFNKLIPMPDGLICWYKWCCANWGTKWNAYDTEVVDDDTISFCTAWADPTPIIYALAEKYPDAIIDHWWADEDRGYNTGHRRFENGEWLEDVYEGGSEEATTNAAFCWGDENIGVVS